ncbi:MAG: hypothetical protein JKY54_12830 [Flavobacteriales bacterium]|nr:hypothetical protein [Flavobacteriales bacterium]
MTQILKLSIFAILLIVFSSSCKKKVHTVNQDYIGTWSGSDVEADYTISIGSNSRAEYNKYKGATTVTATGKARLDGDTFKVGVKKFTVSQHPLEDSLGTYWMVLDDVTYSKW